MRRITLGEAEYHGLISAIASLAEKVESMMAVLLETSRAVRRIDERGVRRGRRARGRELQDRCFALWEAGRGKVAVVNGTNRKVSRGDVFWYMKRELAEIGVATLDQFCGLLRRREKRLSICARRVGK